MCLKPETMLKVLHKHPEILKTCTNLNSDFVSHPSSFWKPNKASSRNKPPPWQTQVSSDELHHQPGAQVTSRTSSPLSSQDRALAPLWMFYPFPHDPLRPRRWTVFTFPSRQLRWLQPDISYTTSGIFSWPCTPSAVQGRTAHSGPAQEPQTCSRWGTSTRWAPDTRGADQAVCWWEVTGPNLLYELIL